MKTNYLYLSLALVGAACQKDPAPSYPAPIADFAFNGSSATATDLTVATYDNVYLIDHSTRAVSYHYALGNDSVRTTASPSFYYAKPGLYTVTLTVQGAGNQTATATRRVRVLERVAKQALVTDLGDRVSSRHYLTNGTYWVVVRLGASHAHYPQPANGDLSFEAPILYQSPKVALTAASLPYAFLLPTPLVINWPAVNVLGPIQTIPNKFGYAGLGYGLELYGQDATGTYLLSTSYTPFYQSQAGSINEWGNDFANNVLQLGYGDVYLRGDYE